MATRVYLYNIIISLRGHLYTYIHITGVRSEVRTHIITVTIKDNKEIGPKRTRVLYALIHIIREIIKRFTISSLIYTYNVSLYYIIILQE